MKAPKSIAIALLAALLPLLPAQDGGKDRIVVGLLKGPTGIGLELLVENPPPLPGGKKFECVILPSVDLMISKIGRGELAFACLPTNTAALLYKAGTGYALAAVIGNGMLSFLTNDASIYSAIDLRGKRIQVSGQGAVPEYVFRSIIASKGMDPLKDVELLFGMPYPEAAAALIAGKIDSALLPEPFATMALSGKASIRSPFDVQAEYALTGGAADYPISVLSVNLAFAKSDPASAKAVLAAAKASIAWVREHPAEAGALEEKLGFGLPAKTAASSIPRSNYVFKTAREARPEVESLFRRFLEHSKEFSGGNLPDDGFYAF
jgi:NitT/TauT family transport system substrate-binding protein